MQRLLAAALFAFLTVAGAFAQPADPQPDPAAPNVFYGSVPPAVSDPKYWCSSTA